MGQENVTVEGTAVAAMMIHLKNWNFENSTTAEVSSK